MRAQWFLPLLFATVAGCHNDQKQPSKRHAKGACTITLSGAQSGSFACGPQESPDEGPLFSYDPKQNESSFHVAFNAPGEAPDFVCVLRFVGKPAVGVTYSFATPEATGQATTHRGDNRWEAARRPNAPSNGTLSVTFTTLDDAYLVSTSTVWQTMHGTVDATMPAAGPATGTVTAHGVF